MPIFTRLAEEEISFQVLQFTWGDPERILRTRKSCMEAGVGYESISVWRKPLAAGAMLTALAGASRVRKAMKVHRIDLVIARSTLPVLATMLALRGSPHPMVFDADGLPLDERVDFAGQSASGLAHRLLRDIEAQAVCRSNVVLTRSSKAAEILHARAGAGTSVEKFHVVTNGRDAQQFKPASGAASTQLRRDLSLARDTPLLVYAGSMGPQYCMAEMLRLFALIHQRRPDAHFLVLTGSPEAVLPALDNYPYLRQSVTTLTVPAQAVPQYLGCADLGLALRQPSFSMQAVAPIKLGEYLLCGLPVVATAGIGDTAAISADAGMLLERMDEDALNAAANWFIDSVLPHRDTYRASSRAAGLSRFSLEASAKSYLQAISHLVRA